jgi:hypothetical protein
MPQSVKNVELSYDVECHIISPTVDSGSAEQTDCRLWLKQRNLQNIIEYLKDFDSKEQFFLVGQILGNPDFTLASGVFVTDRSGPSKYPSDVPPN